ncbi:MAG: winged helix-turn-helix transcriptional regulator [Sporichthyaceae bacterium]
MRHDELAEVYCSVARTWAVIGERWTMLILRECFRGKTRYEDFRTKLGLGNNVLNDRLRLLVEEGVLDRVAYSEQPVRHEYRLTKKGQDLYPVLLAIVGWGDAYKNDVPPMRLTHRACGHLADPRMTCSHCGEPVGWRDMTAQVQPDAW